MKRKKIGRFRVVEKNPSCFVIEMETNGLNWILVGVASTFEDAIQMAHATTKEIAENPRDQGAEKRKTKPLDRDPEQLYLSHPWRQRASFKKDAYDDDSDDDFLG